MLPRKTAYPSMLRVALLIFALTILGVLSLRLLPSVSVDAVLVRVGKSEVIETSLPLQGKLPKNSVLSVSGKFQSSSLGTTALHIVPDDCLLSLSLDGKTLPLDSLSHQELCDYQNGILLSAPELLTDGMHEFEATFKNNRGGPSGFHLGLLHHQRLKSFSGVLLLALLVAGALLLSRLLSLSKGTQLLFIAAIALRFWYWSYTHANIRSYDVFDTGGHLDYITFLAREFALPNPAAGWEYHQPPLYYLLAALPFSLLELFAPEAKLVGLQYFSLVLSLMFLGFSLAAITAFSMPAPARYAAASLLCFWPSGVLHSVRIGNDVAVYAFVAMSFYFLVLWYKREDRVALAYCAWTTALALLAKANALAMLVTVLCSIGTVLYDRNKYPSLRLLRTVLVPLSLALVLSFGDNFYYYFLGESEDWLLGGSPRSLHSALAISNHWANFIVVDLVEYLQLPYTTPWIDAGGRQFFLQYLWKTSLFAQFNFDALVEPQLAIGLSALLLPMLAAMLLGILLSYGRGGVFAPVFFLLLFSVLLQVCLRIKIPASSCGDFRLIYFSVLPFSILVGFAIQHAQILGMHVLSLTLSVLVLIFSLSSLMFFLSFKRESPARLHFARAIVTDVVN